MKPVVSTQPMEDLGSDLFFYKHNWLIVVDRYSGYPFARKLKNITDTKAVTEAIEDFFPLTMDYLILSALRAVLLPAQNLRTGLDVGISSMSWPVLGTLSLTEAGVKNVKSLLIKCLDTGDDF